MNAKYIILELIPTASKDGDIIQLSALKIDNLNLIDRFDYRLIDEKIPLTDLKEMVSYDKDKFIYKNETEEILNEFSNWSEDLPLLILNNTYTYHYLRNLKNEKIDISKYLKIPFSDDIIENIIKKYNLRPSNYIVDLLYEALIYESNRKD
jgi:DNA polymerase III alpha subunit (gram-positive type)